MIGVRRTTLFPFRSQTRLRRTRKSPPIGCGPSSISVPDKTWRKTCANGRLAQRIIDFRKLAADDPENVLGHYRLGQLLATDGQTDEAAKSFERALAISPDFPEGYRYLGECLIKLGQKERAVEALTKGWRVAQDRGEEYPRDAIANLLQSVGAANSAEEVGHGRTRR